LVDDVVIGPPFGRKKYNPGSEHFGSRRGGGSANALQFFGLGFGERDRRGDAWHAQYRKSADYIIKHLMDGTLGSR
jgi:hypothetical protein